MMMATRGWGPRTSLIGLVSIILFIEISPSALANGVISPFNVAPLIAIINFPVNAMLLLVMYHLFARQESTGERLGEGRFIELFLISTLVITIAGAMIDMVVIFDPGLSYWIGSAFVIGVIVFKTTTYFLKTPLRWGIYTALAFFGLNILLWSFLFNPVLDLDILLVILLLLFMLFPVMLIRLAYRYHGIITIVEVEGSLLRDRYLDSDARSNMLAGTRELVREGRFIVASLLVLLVFVSFIT